MLQALSLYQLKKRKEAVAALKDNACQIPKNWLEEINRKSAAYAKQQSHIITEYKKANRIKETIVFTPREKEVLIDLSHGLSRADIAANRRLSVNTVKMVINHIYTKLGAENFADIIRVAVEQKII